MRPEREPPRRAARPGERAVSKNTSRPPVLSTLTPRPPRPTRNEQETVLRWDEDEKLVHVWSASPVTWRKLARLGIEPHRETRRDGQLTGRFYRVPLARFRWGLKSGRLGNPGNLTRGVLRSGDPGRKAVSRALTLAVGVVIPPRPAGRPWATMPRPWPSGARLPRRPSSRWRTRLPRRLLRQRRPRGTRR